jgi:ABC-2 type transport system permease protein/lipopolysaccharide transport system permease protein
MKTRPRSAALIRGTSGDLVAGPSPEIRFRRRLSLFGAIRELWRGRELVRTLTEREFRVRYKQAYLGFAWAIITPVVMMLVFSLIFGRIARVDTGGVPYPLFSYLGLLPWTLFSNSISNGGLSLFNNNSLLNKVYCPREVFPIASVLVSCGDALIATSVLVIIFAVYAFAPTATAVWAPLLLPIQLAYTVGVTLIVSVIVVYLRDMRHALPIILQLGLLATPVAYGMDVYPERLQPLVAVINPLAPVIDGYRRTILYGQQPDWSIVVPGAISAFAFLVVGYVFFKRLETGIADVA